MKIHDAYFTFAACVAVTLTGFAQSAAPQLVQQPRMPYLGASVTFSITATGSPPPSFQWRFRGSDLPGQTNATLTLAKVQFTNAGPYSVVVRNDSGVVMSDSAWLSVLPADVVNLGDRELRFGKLSAPIWEAARKDDQSQSLTGDGLTLVYASTAPGGSGGLDLWMVMRPTTLTTNWGTPVNLGPTVNSAVDENTPRLSRDGLALYFTSNRSGGRGNYDIWVATRAGLATPFGPPVNLGPSINTGSGEAIPQISADNRTLVFSSSRLLGGDTYDVWMSTRTNASAPWEPARLLPAPINHSGDTFPVDISPDGLMLFLKSWRPILDPPGASEPGALYVCRRASTAQPFDAPVLIRPILAIGTGGVDATTLSDDGHTLYLGTYRVVYPDWPQIVHIDVAELPRLVASQSAAAGPFQCDLLGREGANYDVQFSSDLITWLPWLTTNAATSVRLSDPSAAPEGRRFYRVLSH